MSQVRSLPPQPAGVRRTYMARKQHAFDAVTKAIAEARAQGIHIVRQPMFDWTGLGDDRSLPRACDATGAMLIQMG